MTFLFHQTLGSFAIESIKGEYVVVDSYDLTVSNSSTGTNRCCTQVDSIDRMTESTFFLMCGANVFDTMPKGCILLTLMLFIL